ncbi:mechanosensitive ion channel domain-containing protein [Vibrio proteolyticus]|uniref:Small-conductance mechanosensitive channel n=1 Tax=Vibrio proteolyticus NBRC 13287 TaxID=1219065 RepID=U2ZXM7_VIBPR|nr:mechanosensitive ion channel domain-containing protein [Vibrio proteolyticus]GAD66185.1 small-conductance mechanosensitive channel [Vibrio proteolyticus NBRC 13287]
MAVESVNQVSDWLVSHSGLLVQYGVNVIAALLILIVGSMLSKTIAATVEKLLGQKGVDKAVTSFVSSIVRYGILAFVLVAVLSRIGIETASIIAVLGAAGLAVGLALKGSLSNFASGVLIVLFRPFKSGDFIEAAGVSGSVQAIQIFSTILKTGDNKMIVVPNSSIMKGPITNVSRYDTRRINFVFAVSYKADLRQVQQVLREVVESDPRVLKEPEVKIGVNALVESSVQLIVRPWVKRSDYWPVFWDLNLAVKEALDSNGIEIPFRKMDVHLHQVD